jgi:hypothetical protein
MSEYSFSGLIDGDIERINNSTNILSNVTFNMPVLSSFGFNSVYFESKRIQGDYYLKSSILENVVGSFMPENKDLSFLNSWIIISHRDLFDSNDLVNRLPYGQLEIQDGRDLLNNSGKIEQIKSALYSFFVAHIFDAGLQELNGIEMRKYDFVASASSVNDLLTNLDSIIGNGDLHELFLSNSGFVQDISGSVFIDKKSHILKRIEFVVSGEDNFSSMITLDISRENQPVNISVPIDAVSLNDLVQMIENSQELDVGSELE